MQLCIFNILREAENSTLSFHTYVNEHFFQQLPSDSFFGVRSSLHFLLFYVKLTDMLLKKEYYLKVEVQSCHHVCIFRKALPGLRA